MIILLSDPLGPLGADAFPPAGTCPACASRAGCASPTDNVLGRWCIPTVTRRVRSGVTAKSVTRIAVVPHASRSVPSAFYGAKRCGKRVSDENNKVLQYLETAAPKRSCARVEFYHTQWIILRSKPPDTKPVPSGSHARAVTVSV